MKICLFVVGKTNHNYLSLVREDRDGQTSGLPVVPPGAPLGIRVWLG